ncbi:hypothetical protein [Thiohalocapsa sp. ML1]|uniref:hypothetical protein n=1 Tax=Thiohalocapsa sp. ML1 TaxID=1431688 RepID=UPI0012E357EB|nr:hypothetical protein [Thiohalocapsa sp. ML1]
MSPASIGSPAGGPWLRAMPMALLSAALLAGCQLTGPARPTLSTDCSAFAPDCMPRSRRPLTVADGETRQWVDIDSAPTAAAIYVNGRFIGYSPMRYPMAFNSQDRALSIVAVPLYPGQAQQERLIRVPPLPTRVSFFMNNGEPQIGQ